MPAQVYEKTLQDYLPVVHSGGVRRTLSRGTVVLIEERPGDMPYLLRCPGDSRVYVARQVDLRRALSPRGDE